MHILIADDQPDLIVMLKFYLTKLGNEVVFIDRGDFVITELFKNSYDLLILDYNLPVLNGLAILEELRASHLQIKTIIISGSDCNHIAEKVKGFPNVIRIFSKPFNLNELKHFLKSIEK